MKKKNRKKKPGIIKCILVGLLGLAATCSAIYTEWLILDTFGVIPIAVAMGLWIAYLFGRGYYESR